MGGPVYNAPEEKPEAPKVEINVNVEAPKPEATPDAAEPEAE